ncbi:unnamed protein product, partial [Mesorhabditis spiculigera]
MAATKTDEVADLSDKLKKAELKDNGERRRRQQRQMMTEEELQAFLAEKEKKIVKRNVKGTVKWYSVLGHYGFIGTDYGFIGTETEEDVFVHQTSIAKSKTEKYYLRTLGNGEAVKFDIAESDKGLEAVNVTGPDGGEVVGSRYHLLQLPWFRQAFFERKKNVINRKAGDDEQKPRGRNANSQNDRDGKADRKPARTRKPRRNSNKQEKAEKAGERRRRRTVSKTGSEASNKDTTADPAAGDTTRKKTN